MSRPVVLVPTPPHPDVLAGCAARFDVIRLWEADDPDAVLQARGPEVVGLVSPLGVPVDGPLLDRMPKLQIVACFGVGYDNVDVAAASARGVTVTNTPDVLDAEVADTALALILMAVRRLGAAERYLRAGRWAAEGPFPLTGSTVGRTLGVYGMGRIGLAIADRALAFGMSIEYHNRRPRDVAFRYRPSLVELARNVDVLVVAVPGGAGTRHAVDADVLAALGPDGVLVNVGRGTTVDTEALVAALAAGTIAGAGLDVFEDEPHVPDALLGRDDVVLLPHVASATVATRRRMAELVVANLAAWFDTGAALTPVPG